MTREKLMSIYKNAVESICREYNDDLNIGFDKLVSSVKGHFGLTYAAGGEKLVYDEYKGVPDGFDYSGFMSDYIKFIAH